MTEVRALAAGHKCIFSLYFGHVVAMIRSSEVECGVSLDVGCGPKLKELRILQELGSSCCIGLDIHPTAEFMRDDADTSAEYYCTDRREVIPIQSQNRVADIHLVQADVDEYDFPLASDRFDLVMLNSSIEHIYHPREVLEECHRILKPGGHIRILTPNQARLDTRLRLLRGESIYYPIEYWLGSGSEHVLTEGRRRFAGHIREYTKGE